MPPSVMPFNSPHEPASGGKENSSGGPLPRGLLDPAINGESPLKSGHPRPIAAECCPCLPVCHSCHVHPWLVHVILLEQKETLRDGPACFWRGAQGHQRGHSSFGCSVNLPLGSRSADPHSTTVCCGNLLHSSPQPHTAGVVLHLPRWSTCYCNQDLRQETLKPGVTPAGTAISHVHSTCQCSACCCHSGSGL